ncbi:Poly(A) polymerase pla1 [Ceratocystis lukuohia]|uniref:Poly(A) polymerase n=1 Tax=Ceratocystis lukuohia TaxID=2019550 RepID=A0ABR4MD65_9PEZI
MMPQPESSQTLGMTPPISTKKPTDEEMAANAALLEELRSQGTFESPAETEKRHKVLASLQKICDEFVRRAAIRREKGDAVLKSARGKVFTYGSFRLGVYGPGSDIDTLVVAPKYVTREDYFDIFPNLLLEMTPPGAITDMSSVQDAFVPIIKFEYNGISIDLIFSRIAVLQELPSDPNFDLKDSNLLRGLDDKELRSLNGTRVTDEILNLVPEKGTFRLALRAIKLWAQRRAVYANIMGFPGGVAWAMLVARVCQLYPKANSSTIVCKFFHIMRLWPWPQPVLLKMVESGPLRVRVWNPQVYKADQYHLMPIITPAYPSMCATYNITESSKKIINRELNRGGEIADEIVTGQKPWSELFVKHTFFTTGYKYYLAVTSASTTKEAHKKWSGFIESKARVLVQNVDRHDSIEVAHIFVKGFERVHRCKATHDIQKVLNGSQEFAISSAEAEQSISKEGGDANKTDDTKVNGIGAVDGKIDGISTDGTKVNEAETNIAQIDSAKANGTEAGGEKTDADETAAPKEDDDLLYTLTHYVGLELKKDAKSLDLSTAVADFKEVCIRWDKYEPEVNFLNIAHMRNFDLPDDVFEEGEAKPKRKAIKRVRRAESAQPTEMQAKKRRMAPEVAEPPTKKHQSVAAT